jgi:octaprenyl-diphosphate synthase
MGRAATGQGPANRKFSAAGYTWRTITTLAAMSTTAVLSRTAPPTDGLDAIQCVVSDELAAVDRTIAAHLHSDVALVNQVAEHIIHSGGKRLRPLLTLIGARACGYQGQAHVTLAAIVEFIHTATLLHDDVVDDSRLRRGQLTANAMFGNEASVLVGDFLYSRAFQLMVAAGSMRVMDIMADTTNAIAEGEVMQLLNCHDPETTEQRYLQVIHAKTAKLFEAAARVGAVLSESSPAVEEALAAYGLHLGIAYQLIDDVLDYHGEAEAIGKNVGDDLAEGKPTLPLIHAMRQSNAEDRALIRAAIEQGGLSRIDDVIAAVERTGAIAYTADRARHEAERAGQALSMLPASAYRDALESLAVFAVTRTH